MSTPLMKDFMQVFAKHYVKRAVKNNLNKMYVKMIYVNTFNATIF
jgi:hypothetical protein